jgi:dTDP-4-dehydrorhamnose 3,5-epimerase
MIFNETKLPGVYVIDLERSVDERGFFARAWCEREFAAHGLTARLSQINVSHNALRGTLRGMHWQRAPHEEAKAVSCLRGAIYDVALDLRADSPTYLQWFAAELTAENRRQMFIPAGCAHGFQTLTDDAEALYFMSEFYSPQHGAGVRYDDSAFAIQWPLPVTNISPADQAWPDFSPEQSFART